MRPDLSVYLVTDSEQLARQGRTALDCVLAAVAGGVTSVQVREKDAEARDVLHLVTALSERLPPSVGLFVNDRVDVFLAARALGARVSGVHVGQTDLPVALVRQLVGSEALIGLSAATESELADAESSPARVDYLGIGAVRDTSSKADAPTSIGVDGVARLARRCSLPAVAIGGIVPADLPLLRAGGLAGAAVVSWVCSSPDPRAAADELRHAWDGAA